MRRDLAGCFGKFGFEDPKKAGDVARRMGRRGRKVNFYHCVHCQRWHVGSSLKKRLKDWHRRQNGKRPSVDSWD